MTFRKRVYARSVWRRPWLWDFGATLGVINGFFVPVFIRDQVPSDIEGVAVIGALIMTYCAVVGVFTLADRRFGEQLPSLSEAGSAFVLVQIPATVVFLYVGVVLVADLTVWHDGTDRLITTLVLVAANAAVLSGGSLLVARRASRKTE